MSLLQKAVKNTSSSPGSDADHNSSSAEFEWTSVFNHQLIPTDSMEISVYSHINPLQASAENGLRTCIVFHHGGGYSALSWALACSHLLDYDLIAYDCRLHGQTRCINGERCEDMSIDALSNDLWKVVEGVAAESYSTDLKVEYVLVGHSLGGPVVVDAAIKGVEKLKKRIVGVVVVDVVEGTALEALSHMKNVVSTRRTQFQSVDDAVKYAITSGMMRNIDSARVSVPSQLKYDSDRQVYEWIVDLAQTEKWWAEWFKDLSTKFLSVRGGRMLMLANTDRLDKTLTVAQIQGRFQMTILMNVGHAIHEDQPEQFADHIRKFAERNSQSAIDRILKMKKPGI